MQNHHCESCPQVPETRSDALGRAIPGPFAHISNTYQYEASLRVKWGGAWGGVLFIDKPNAYGCYNLF